MDTFEKNLYHVGSYGRFKELFRAGGGAADFPMPDLILLDSRQGLEALQYVKGHRELLYTPVVVLSHPRQGMDVQEAYASGANGCLQGDLGENPVETLRTLAQFWFSLVQLPTGETKKPMQVYKPGSTPINTQSRIMLVEDQPLDAKIFQQAAEELNFDHPLAIVDSAEAALEMLQADSGTLTPDFVLLDIRLPGMNGDELLDQIRPDPRLCNLQVVAMSGFDDVRKTKELYSRKANAFIPKPMEYAGVVDMLAILGQWYSIVSLPGG